MGMPIFLISDFRNVGYANPWARPPVDVYGQVAVGIFDGADLIWKQAVGDGTFNVQPFLGTAKSHLPGNFNFKFKQLIGANTTYEIGSWLFRAGYVHTKIDGHSPNLDGLVAVMQTVPLPGWSQATSALVIEHKDASFAGLGVTYDDGQWLFQSEYTQRRTDSFVDDTNGWYSTLGYRFGDVMPYVSYGHVDTQVNHVTDGLFAPTPQLAGLKAAVIDTKAGADQHTASIGARWNFHKNVDFKLQYDHVTTETGKDNFFVNAKPSFAGHSVSVITAAFDFVF
jgi:predicted porin